MEILLGPSRRPAFFSLYDDDARFERPLRWVCSTNEHHHQSLPIAQVGLRNGAVAVVADRQPSRGDMCGACVERFTVQTVRWRD